MHLLIICPSFTNDLSMIYTSFTHQTMGLVDHRRRWHVISPQETPLDWDSESSDEEAQSSVDDRGL